MRGIFLRRHGPKGVSAGAAGSQLLQKPAREAQGNPNAQAELLGLPPCVLNKRYPFIPSLPFSESPLPCTLPS